MIFTSIPPFDLGLAQVFPRSVPAVFLEPLLGHPAIQDLLRMLEGDVMRSESVHHLLVIPQRPVVRR
jgi:hypothetical protein